MLHPNLRIVPLKPPKHKRPQRDARENRSGPRPDQRLDRRPDRRTNQREGGRRSGRVKGAGGGAIWLYGRHPVFAALANPTRQIERLLATPSLLESEGEQLEALIKGRFPIEEADPKQLDRLIGPDSVHQGLAIAARPLDQPDVAELRPASDAATVVVIDQATDPRNVGAVIRAAAAFSATAVVTTARSAPEETGALVKATAGTFEQIAYVQATNLARAIRTLQEAGYWTVGLDGASETGLADAPFDRPTALVIGAEGRGLRRLTAEACDALVRIPIAESVESLNLATAAAIALYERSRK